MALTGSEVAGSAPAARAPGDGGRDEAGWIARWARRDPVRAVAALLIVVGVAWRAQIASGGYLAQDDFALASRAIRSDLTADFLLDLYNNHFMPAGQLLTWLVTRETGLAYWPYLLLLIAGQALLSVAFYRLLRRLVRPGWGLLIPLCMLLFSPLTLEANSWWAVGVNLLPMQLAMVLAIGAQVRYVRTRRMRHLVTLVLSVLLGLLFFEKSLLIVPLTFLVTACFFVSGGPTRSIARTLRRYWPSWLALAVLSVAYLWLYLSRAGSSVRSPNSADEVLTFLRQLVGHTLLPGLVGGPWRWLDAGDGTPGADPPEIARWLAWAVFVALIVVTVRLRRTAVRAWVLLAAYLALVSALLSATRLGSGYSPAVGLLPRYVGEVVVVAALSVGVALLGLRDTTGEAPAAPWTWPAALRDRGFIALATVVALVGGMGAAWSGARFADDWAVKQGRDYLRTAQAEIAAAPPGTVFFDEPVPAGVVDPVLWPYNLQSNFFRPTQPQPVFVTEAETLSMLDDTGRVRQAWVAGPAIQKGPEENCGHRLSAARPVWMPLDGTAVEFEHVVRIGYLSSGDSPATFRLGDAVRQFEVKRGLHQIFFKVVGGGGAVELMLTDPAVTLCTNEITVGKLVPWP